MFFITWGTKQSARVVNKGKFNCPTCNSIQSYKVISVQNTPHVWFVSAGAGEEVMRFMECQTCKSKFNTSHYKISESSDSSDEITKEATWDCPKCKFDNPNNSYKCKKCGYSLV